uniref:Uncharacterized protein n=1 Tax=viral metagenome TaxID=1070528 RepID=A0A6C0DLB7_9ZZZZ
MNPTLENEKIGEEFVKYLEKEINNDFSNIDNDEKDKILKLVDKCVKKYDAIIDSTFVNATPINIEDNAVNEASATNNDRRSITRNLKIPLKFAYNTTIGEVRNGRIPILDSIHRTIYRKLYNKNGEHGSTVFPKDENYYKLGGKKVLVLKETVRQ